MMALSFSKGSLKCLFKHNWLGAFGLEYHCFPTVLLGGKLRFKDLYIYVFFYQLFFLGNAENIAQISVTVISFRNDSDSQEIYFMTFSLNFLHDFRRELTLWPPPVLSNGEHSHQLHSQTAISILWVQSPHEKHICN